MDKVFEEAVKEVLSGKKDFSYEYSVYLASAIDAALIFGKEAYVKILKHKEEDKLATTKLLEEGILTAVDDTLYKVNVDKLIAKLKESERDLASIRLGPCAKMYEEKLVEHLEHLVA